MATKIYVENLPIDITEDRLREIFGQIGSVESVRLKTDLLFGRPKGSGYVEMSLEVDAYRAVNCFHGASFKDNKIYLREVKPFYERARELLRHRIGIITHHVEMEKRSSRKVN